MVLCLFGECINLLVCNLVCKFKGYRGGVCVKMDFGVKSGVCCCRCNFEF